jgi:hypothetical protein
MQTKIHSAGVVDHSARPAAVIHLTSCTAFLGMCVAQDVALLLCLRTSGLHAAQLNATSLCASAIHTKQAVHMYLRWHLDLQQTESLRLTRLPLYPTECLLSRVEPRHCKEHRDQAPTHHPSSSISKLRHCVMMSHSPACVPAARV